MPFEERIWDLRASHKSLWPHPTSASSLFVSLAFQNSPLAKPRTEITGLGPPFPAPSLLLSYSHLHRFPSTGRLSRTNHVPCTTALVLQPASWTGHREAASTSWWLLALLAFPVGDHDPLSHPSLLKMSHLHDRCASFSLVPGRQEVSSSLSSPRARCSPAAEPLLCRLRSHMIFLAFKQAIPVSCSSTASSPISSGGW